jgi:hypothetical protein
MKTRILYFPILVFIFMDFPGAKNTKILKSMLNAALKSKELAFLPSYFFEPPTDASKTNTLYISIVVKELVTDNEEKSAIMNALMEKKSA